MKKILLLTACLTFVTTITFAQSFGGGPKVGASFNTVNGIEGATHRTGVVAGMFADYIMANRLGVQVELLYNMQGWRYKDADAHKIKVDLDYVYMPVIAKYYLAGGLSVQLGTQFGFLVNSNIKGGTEDYKIDKYINKYNVDIVAGLGYEFNVGLIIEGRYVTGLTNIQNITDANSVRNGGLMVTAGWRF